MKRYGGLQSYKLHSFWDIMINYTHYFLYSYMSLCHIIKSLLIWKKVFKDINRQSARLI